MKIEKKKIFAALLAAAFGIIIVLAGIKTGNADIPEGTKNSLEVSTKFSIEEVKFTDESGEVQIDLDRLKEENPDIYGWITVPGTEIDYPI